MAQVEACASELAAPFTSARKAPEVHVLLGSADPLAHLERRPQGRGDETCAPPGGEAAPRIQKQLLAQPEHLNTLKWEAEPAEAWSLMCTLYDIEARVLAEVSLSSLRLRR